MAFRAIIEKHQAAQGQAAERTKLKRLHNDLLAKKHLHEETGTQWAIVRLGNAAGGASILIRVRVYCGGIICPRPHAPTTHPVWMPGLPYGQGGVAGWNMMPDADSMGMFCIARFDVEGGFVYR